MTGFLVKTQVYQQVINKNLMPKYKKLHSMLLIIYHLTKRSIAIKITEPEKRKIDSG
jgi:hypothetical protein